GRALPRDPAGGGGNNENRNGCDRIDDHFGGRSIAPFRAGGSSDDGARPIDGEGGEDPDDRRPEDGAPWPWRIWRGERAVHGGWFGGGDRRGDGGWTEGVPDPDEPPRRGCEQLRARGRRIPAGEPRQHTG